MHETPLPLEPPGDLVALQALLYAQGELDPAETTAFEQRLGEDQPAREALCLAVQLTSTTAQQGLVPDPSYREHVRRRLRQRQRWSWLLSRRVYRGHPAVWIAVGAAAAAVLVMALAQLPVGLLTRAHDPLPEPTAPREEAVPAPAVEQPQLAATEHIATIWADLHSTKHVTKAHDEEMRRKQRLEERNRATRQPERRSYPLSNQAPR
jgi:hypothetical protein